MTRRHDWTTIRREYVEASSEKERPTYEQLAQKYGVSIGYLRQRASREKWAEQANKHLTNIERSRRKKLIEERSTTLARIDSALVSVAEALLKQHYEQLLGMQNENERLKKEKKPLKFLKYADSNHLAQNLVLLRKLVSEIRGDDFVALQHLCDSGLISENASFQIAQTLEEHEERLREIVGAILKGDCPD